MTRAYLARILATPYGEFPLRLVEISAEGTVTVRPFVRETPATSYAEYLSLDHSGRLTDKAGCVLATGMNIIYDNQIV